MSSSPAIADDLRSRILQNPAAILDDPDVMRALVAANERMLGPNIVDLRGVAMERLEARLDRLEETHRSVIAAAYENISGTNQIHRAILRLLEPASLEEFAAVLDDDVTGILRIDCLRLAIEAEGTGLETLAPAIRAVPAGFCDGHTRDPNGREPRRVTLRRRPERQDGLYEDRAATIRSEALLRLTLGTGAAARTGLLAMGSRDAEQFAPNQGTDLLEFFAGVVERALGRHLA